MVRIIRSAFWIAGIAIIASLLLLTVHFSSNVLEFSQYNSGWNGTSSFFSDLNRHQATFIETPSQLAAVPGPATLLIIAPMKVPKASEIRAYREFLAGGNTLILIDDFGTGNDILQGIGSQVSILPGNLSSIDREYADPYSVVVYGTTDSSLADTSTTVVLNRPAALDGGKTLLMTSVLSWIDTNGDRKLSLDEPMGNFPVLVQEDQGTGNLIVFSDPSVLTNAMYAQDKRDNLKLIRHLSGNSTLLIDQMNSRTADTDGLSSLIYQTRSNLGFKILFLFMLVLLLAAVWRSRIL